MTEISYELKTISSGGSIKLASVSDGDIAKTIFTVI